MWVRTPFGYIVRALEDHGHSRSAAKPVCVAAIVLGLVIPCAATGIEAQEVASSPGALKKLTVEELMNIEVTSVSRRPEKLSEAASAIQVITAEDIRRSGATSLPEALRLASNLEVAQIDARQWAISARGFNSTTANKLLVLIDGRTVYTPLYAGVFWDVQDVMLEDIDRIEVISGPGATLWGSNAVNGVINITTRRPQETRGALFAGGGGRQLSDFGAARYGGKVGESFDYRVYVKRFDRDHSALPDGTDVSDGWRLSQGGFRVEDRPSAQDTLALQGDVYDGRAAQSTAADIEVGGGNVLGRWSRAITESSDIQLQAYFDRAHRRIPRSYAENLNTYNVDLQQRFSLGERQEIVWGLGYRLIEDKIENPALFGFLPPDVSRRWYSAYVQDAVTLMPERLQLILGTKIEHNDYTGAEFQPTARLAWRVSQQNLFWSAVSRAVRTPSRVDRELYAPSGPPFGLLQGGADFDSETLIAYELGYRGHPGERLGMALSTFYNDYDDLRSIEHVNPPELFPIFIGNGLRGESYGAELTAEYPVTSYWRLHGGYTELRIHFDHKPGSTDTNPGTSEAHDPKHLWSLRSSVDMGDWQLDATYRHVSRIDNQDVPGYGELDLRLAWQVLRALEISVTGQNLLHERHVEFGTNTPMVSSTRKAIERGVYGKVLWRP
jgi:iron complex outermembrane receptor protein